MKIIARRDLKIIDLPGNEVLVISCDSCGGIGLKKDDIFKISPFIVGKFTARVGLLEIISVGAEPILICDMVSCEMNPTGKEIINGIKEELKIAGYPNVEITGSTEENFESFMTALGLVVIGKASKNSLFFRKAVSGDFVYLLGTPKVGQEVDLEDSSLYFKIEELKKNRNILEIVPVGSKGAIYEAELLAKLNNLEFYRENFEEITEKSAGPATCLVVISKEKLENFLFLGCFI